METSQFLCLCKTSCLFFLSCLTRPHNLNQTSILSANAEIGCCQTMGKPHVSALKKMLKNEKGHGKKGYRNYLKSEEKALV